MMITAGKLRQLIHEATKHDLLNVEAQKKHEELVDSLIRRFPLLRKIKLGLSYASFTTIRAGKQNDRDGHVINQAELKQIHSALTTDPSAIDTWRVGSLQKDDHSDLFQITRMSELRADAKKKNTQAAARRRSTSVDVKLLDVLPVTTFTRTQLYNAGKTAGLKLYGNSASGLIWDAGSPTDALWETTNTYRWALRLASIINEDALDYETFQPPDFSYVFFPSRPGSGLDVGEKMHFVRDRGKMVDVDGNIYLVDNISGTTFSIIRPTLTSKKEYVDVVTKTLAERNV